ncbi:DUF5803 family protein [Natrialbaceae archaeon A-gly3]
MNRRLLLATVAVLALVGLAGCSAIFGGISDEDLDREQEYDDLKDREADVVVDIEDVSLISSGEFRAVYDLDDTEEIELYRSSFYRDTALDVEAVRYWYPNGTEVTGSELEVDQGRSSTDIEVPDGNGTLAFTASAGSRTFQLPAYIGGSYEVTLDEGYRTSGFLFGNVAPSGYDREIVDDRERLTWEENDGTISLRYYLPRDVRYFYGLVAIVLFVGGLGAGYYYRQMKRLQEKRQEMGLDVEIDDDDDSGPPPGLR